MNIITEVNKNFVIRYKFDQDKKTSIKGAGKYSHLLEKAKNPEEMALNHFNKALNSELTKINIRLRGGLSVTFHIK
jgi:uncharacterized protein with von Willebrand factor type A (vWA) domain